MCAWDPTKPAGSQKLRLSDDEIRANYDAIDTALGTFITAAAALTATAAELNDVVTSDNSKTLSNKKHDLVRFSAQAADPTLDANEGQLYTKDVNAGSGALAELFWSNETEKVCQITYLNAGGTAVGVLGIVTGIVMAFGNNTAPTGWTRLTTGDTIYDAATDNAMFCFAKTGNIAQGGSVSPQATHTHTGGDHTLTLAEMPAHTHAAGNGGLSSGGSLFRAYGEVGVPAGSRATGSNGYDGSHNHGATSANTAPYYIEMILAKKV